jgi:hypothetical protein
MNRSTYSFMGEYKPTPLRAKIEKCVAERREKIIHEKLAPWWAVGTGKPLRVAMHTGKLISQAGVRFEGPDQIFWSRDFIPPFLEDAIEDVFAEVAGICCERGLPPEDYLTEAGGYLEGMVQTIYNEMARMEARLTKRQHYRDVSEYVENMLQRIKAHKEAARLLAGPGKNPTGPGRDGKGKRRIPRTEANVEVRRLLKKTPSWDWTVRTLATKVGCSIGTISNCPAWKAYKEWRDRVRKEGTIRTVSLTSEMEAVLGVDSECLPELIAEQEAEDRDDVRQAKLYLSHRKKGEGRES